MRIEPSSSSPASWRQDAAVTAMLYAIVEKGLLLPVVSRDSFASELFGVMAERGLVEDFAGSWRATPAGHDAMRRAVAVHDVLRHMEIFSRVNVARVLTPDEVDPDGLRADLFDPRFAPDDPDAMDMRLAIISWLCQTSQNRPVDLNMIVFLQRLGSGKLFGHGFWEGFASGRTFSSIEEIVDSAYKWEDMVPGDRDASSSAALALYSAGQTEIRKREGSACSGCGIPLFLYEEAAAVSGGSVASCPGCARVFPGPPSLSDEGAFACPKCEAMIFSGETRCGGCGALIDFSLPSGTVQTDVVETIWSSNYGYVSYGWLSPRDPFLDAAVLACLFYTPW